MIIHTSSGEQLSVRQLRSQDGPLLVRFFHSLSPHTRWQRFFRSLEGVSQQWVRQEARRIARIDPALQIALLALSSRFPRPRMVAGAQLVRPARNSPNAELAVVVCDEYQRQRVGSQLVRLLLEQGRSAGISSVSATMFADNEAMYRSLQALGLPLTSAVSAGERSVVVSL